MVRGSQSRRGLLFVIVMLAAVFVVRAERLSLDGMWDFRFEADKPLEDLGGLPAFEANDKLPVPGCWDTMSCYYNRRGTGCYRRTFTVNGTMLAPRLVVDGMGLRARFWLDGRDLGLVKLPWSKVELPLGAVLELGEHELVAAVDSTVDAERTKLFRNNYDFYAFGGFHHGVRIEFTTQQVDYRRVIVRTRDYRTGLVELELEPWQGGNSSGFFFNGELTVVFDNRGYRPFGHFVDPKGAKPMTVKFTDGKALVKVPNFKLWSPEAPNLHTVYVSGPDSQLATPAVEACFGIRQVGTKNGRITLNGEPIYLKGVNRHEAHPEFGVTTPRQLMYEDLRNVKDLGGNFIRGAHYPQCDEFLDLCDELGVLVWEESLGWGNDAGQMRDPEFCALQLEQTRLMVRNSINHPSVIISAFLNECGSNSPEVKALVDRLIAAIRAEDSGHLVTFACNYINDDICHAGTDLIAYNTYPCWYSYPLQTGSGEEMRANIRKCHADIVRTFRQRYPDERPIIVSETGVKADYGVHDPRGLAQCTEDFQAEYTRLMLEEVFACPELAGIAIWQLTDAKAYTRVGPSLPGRPGGINTGGIYDLYRRPKLAVETVRRLFKAHQN